MTRSKNSQRGRRTHVRDAKREWVQECKEKREKRLRALPDWKGEG